MDITIDLNIISTLIIFAVCIGGATYTAFVKGVQRGAEECLVILQEQKLIRINEAGEIDPY